MILLKYALSLSCVCALYFFSWKLLLGGALPFSSRVFASLLIRCAELRLKAELSALNGRRPESLPTGVQQPSSPVAPLSPLQKATSSRMPLTDISIDPIVLEAMSQKEKYEYYKAVQSFVERLAQISDSLRAVPPLERNAALHAEVTQIIFLPSINTCIDHSIKRAFDASFKRSAALLAVFSRSR